MRRVGLVLLCLALPVFGLAVPNTALAADQPVVNWAESDPDDPGTLEVSVTSAQAITHLKAHVLSPSTGAELAATEDFALRSGTAEDGVWATKDTFKLDALGYYPVTVDATAADGSQVTTTSGHLTYYAQTTFDALTADRQTVTYDHRDVTVSGRLLSRSPGTHELTAFAGATVPLNIGEYDRIGNPTDFDTVELHTDTDGRFSYTRTLTGSADFYAYYPFQNEDHLASNSDTLVVGVTQSPVHVTATAEPARVDAGGQITVSGQATWESPTGSQPLAGATFFLDGAPGTPEVTTDADGRYTTTLVPYVSGDIKVTYEPRDAFLADAATAVKVTVVQPSAIRDFDAGRGEEAGTVNVSGTLDFPGPESPGEADVDIEFSPDGTTWSRKATLRTVNGFSGTVTADGPGYWRAHYLGAEMFQPSVSKAVYADPR